MKQSFPKMLYKLGGSHKIDGAFYSYVIVDEDGYEAAIDDGWALTPADAALVPDEPGIDDPPTRDEMEQQAKSLGIGFNKRTTDETLLERIKEAMSHVVDETPTD